MKRKLLKIITALALFAGAILSWQHGDSISSAVYTVGMAIVLWL